VVNSRPRRARKAVDYTYNTKDLDKAIKEYNQERYADSDADSGSDDDVDEGAEHEAKVQVKPRQLRRAFASLFSDLSPMSYSLR
jgi:uncharacterized protein YdaT